jgi:2-C-methyl-D-erythritol 4-phosphate cytidylyltransferase/2-C-methyl-D-erythritol 2,4-cyclodiphosphate synthase
MQQARTPPRIRTVALVVAAGTGSRAESAIPKQYLTLGGKTVLRRSLEAFAFHSGVEAVMAVIGAGSASLYQGSIFNLSKLLPPATGGESRQQSVRSGLEALAQHAPERVLVHDAARPFVSNALISKVIAACDERHGAIPALAVTETVKRVAEGRVLDTVPRQDLVTAQTPQGFPFDALLEAHRTAASAGRNDLTDDAAVAALAGIPVRIVEGDRRNQKLTTPADLAAAEATLAGMTETRTAQGFDVHAFGPGSAVRLCGVELPHEQGLVGHSDADVGLHALTDALLGTIGDGDIGMHFPPSDPQWRDASSDRFLADAAGRVRARGGRILHLDVTLICERPTIGPHRENMRAAIARIAEVPVARVSVKATTTEQLGFTGRGEGIAALAVATVALPAEA